MSRVVNATSDRASDPPAPAGVERLQEASGARFAHIVAARARTDRLLAERAALLAEIDVDPDAAVVLTGSWGRREVTSASDDDFIVLLEGAAREGARPDPDAVAEVLGSGSAGREGVFAGQVSLQELRDRIGRDEDSNRNLTRRMLLILESAAICGVDVHARARRALLERYLAAHQKDHRPPRFLLNDLVRYWRTIAVDFESKMRDRRGEGWGVRNAKLRLSRKALFAGGLLPVLDCYRYPAAQMLGYLDERMAVPPLDRIADAFVDHEAIDPGVRALTAYDAFLGILDDPAQRAELSALSREDRHDSAVFARIADLGLEFESGLLSLLFDDPELRRHVRDYLIF